MKKREARACASSPRVVDRHLHGNEAPRAIARAHPFVAHSALLRGKGACACFFYLRSAHVCVSVGNDVGFFFKLSVRRTTVYGERETRLNFRARF